MKKTILFIVFFSFFALVIPGSSLFADIGAGGQVNAGADLFILPPLSDEGDGIALMPVVPLIDLGFYAQFNFGMVNLGAGIRGFSLIIINVFFPSVYAELNLWRFTLNAQVGGGVIYLFPLYMIAGPYIVPELSLWFNVIEFSRNAQVRLGFGALTLLSPETINQEVFRDISNKIVYYLAAKVAFNFPWVEW